MLIEYLKKKRIILLLNLFLLSWIFLNIFFRFIHSHITFDEGYNLQIALNIGLGNGYRTFQALFDPFISTGPTVLLPASLFVLHNFLFPRIAVILYTIVFFAVVKSIYIKNNFVFVLFLSLFLLTPLSLFFASHVYGELPGTVFVLLGFWQLSKNRLFPAGIFLGLAFITKAVFAIGLTAGLIVFLYSNKYYVNKRFEKAIYLFLGFALPLFIWSAYMYVSFGSIKAISSFVYSLLLVFRAQAFPRTDLLLSKIHMVWYMFYMPFIWFIFLCLFVFLGALKSLKKQILYKYLLIYAYLYFGYFFMFNPTAYYRHFYPFLIAFIIFFAKYIFFALKKHKRVLYVLLFLTIAITTGSFVIFKKDIRYSRMKNESIALNESFMFPTGDSLLLNEQKKAALAIKLLPYPIAGNGWYNSPEISYIARRPIYRNIKKGKYAIFGYNQILFANISSRYIAKICKSIILKGKYYIICRK